MQTSTDLAAPSPDSPPDRTALRRFRRVQAGAAVAFALGTLYLAADLPRLWPHSWPILGTHLAALAGALVSAGLSAALAWRPPAAVVRARTWRRAGYWRWWLVALGTATGVTLAVGQFEPRDVFRASLLCLYAVHLVPFVSGRLFASFHRPAARRVLRGFDLAAFNVLLLVLLLEIGLRGLAAATGSPLLSAPNVKAAKRVTDYRLKPGQMHLGYPANGEGFYDEPFVRAKPPGALRVLGLADSFGVETAPYPDNFLTRLETELAAADPALPPVQVWNLSVDAISPAGYLHLLRERWGSSDADLAVVCVFVGNDIGWLPQHEVATPLLRRETWYAWFVTERILRIASEAKRRTDASPVVPSNAAAPGDGEDPHDASPHPRGAGDDGKGDNQEDDAPPRQGPAGGTGARADRRGTFSPEAFQAVERKRLPVCLRSGRPGALDARYPQLREILRRMREVTGGRLLLVVIPDEFQVDDALWARLMEAAPQPPEAYDRLRPQREIDALCGALGIERLDLLDPLREAHAPDAPVYALRDTHWNRRGHAVAAERIARRLAPLLREMAPTKARGN